MRSSRPQSPHRDTRRRGWLAGLAGPAAWLLAACASALLPHSIDIDQARLQRSLGEHFPYQMRWLGVVEVAVATPQLRLLPQANRVATDLDLTADDRLFGHSLHGSLSVESGLRFEAADGTLRMTNVHVDRLALAGLPEGFSEQTGRLGALLVEQLLEGMVLHRFTPEQLDRLQRAGVRPGDVRVTASGLHVDLVPESAP